MHCWASGTKLLTAKKEPRVVLLNICFIIQYQFIPLMIYRYSSIQCTDFYQLPTASNLQDKKHSWIDHLLIPIPLACSRLWDSRVRRIEKAQTWKNLEETRGRRVSLSPFLFRISRPTPLFTCLLLLCLPPLFHAFPTTYIEIQECYNVFV